MSEKPWPPLSKEQVELIEREIGSGSTAAQRALDAYEAAVAEAERLRAAVAHAAYRTHAADLNNCSACEAVAEALGFERET